MSDLSIMSEATQHFQQYQSDQASNLVSKPALENDFQKALRENHLQDPEFMKAMQRKKIKETAVEFEAQFLGQMLQPMFEGVGAAEPFGGGHAEKMWQSMLVQEYGKAIARNGGIGLADQVEEQILRTQEGK